jgi:hypothetical protein
MEDPLRKTGRGMLKLPCEKYTPHIFTGTDLLRHYPSGRLLFANTDLYAIVGFFFSYGTLLGFPSSTSSQ